VDSEAVKVGNIESDLFIARDTADHEYTAARLVDQGVSNGRQFGVEQQYFRVFQELPADNATLVQIGEDRISFTENGLMVVEQQFVARAGHTLTGTVGTTETTVAGKTVKLATNQFGERGKVSATVVKRWAEPGILDAEVNFAKDGILYVTFVSQGTRIRPTALAAGKTLTDDPNEAFIGGAEAPLFRNRIRNVSGFRQYVTTVMLKHNGNVLDPNSDNEVASYQKYEPYTRPGFLRITVEEGPEGFPGLQRFALVNIIEVLSTDSNLGGGYKPFSVAQWANYNAAWTPTETGIRQRTAKGANGYLASSSSSGSGTFWGEPVSSYAFSAGSNPTPAAFNALADQVIGSDNGLYLVTDEGIKWYRKVKVQMVGRMDANLGAI
jgi:hypothetical protein